MKKQNYFLLLFTFVSMLWGIQLKAAELFNQVSNTTLVVQYLFNETSGNIAADASGNGYDIDLENNDISNWELIDGVLSLKMSGVVAKVDSAVKVDNLHLQEFSIVANVYRNADVTDWVRIAGGDYGFNINPDSTIGLWYSNNNGNDWFGTVSVPKIPLNTWTHVAVTRKQGEVHLYINGEEVETVHPGGDMANDSIMDYDPDVLFSIGSDGNGGRILNGNVSDLQIHEGVLSAWEISRIANPLELIAQYEFNETSGNTAADISGNGFDIALENNDIANWETIDGTASLKMAGVVATVDSAVKVDNMHMQKFSIVANVYRNADVTDWVRIAGGDYGFNINPDSTLGLWYSNNNGNDWFGTVSVTKIPLNEWTHVAATRTQGDVHLYINGVEVETVHPGGDMANDGIMDYDSDVSFSVGSDGNGARILNGNVSDFRIYQGILSATEINRIANPAELVVQYMFNETSGNTAADASDNSFDIALDNNDIANWETIDGRAGLKMAGVVATVDMTSKVENLQLQNFTIATYIYRFAEVSDWARISGGDYGFNINPEGTLALWYSNNNGNDWYGTVSVDAVPLNAWTHVAATRMQGEVHLYINGIEVATVHPGGDMANDGVMDYDSDISYSIGSDGDGGRIINANISDFQIYSGVMTAEEINDIVHPSALVVNYSFDETSGNTAADASGNEYAMTLVDNVDSNWETLGVLPSLKMNGVTATIDSAVIADDMVGQNFTIATYVYRNAAIDGDYAKIAGGGFNVNSDGTVGMWYSNNDGNDWFGTVSEATIPMREWTHIAVTRKSGEVIIYINGNAVEVVHPGGAMEDDAEIDSWWFDNFSIGSNGSGEQFLNANFSDFRFYSGVLSATQIKGLQKDLTVKALLAYYKFDVSGAEAIDAAAGVNVPLMNTDEANWGDGVVKGSIMLNGTDQYGKLADADGGDQFKLAEAFTISAYIKHDDSMDGKDIGEWIAGYGDNYGLYVHPDGVLECYIHNSDWQGVQLADVNLLDGYWHHVAGSWDAETKAINLFLDGVLVATDIMDSGIDFSEGDGFYIGNMSAEDRSWTGSIDELRIHQVAMTEAQLQELVATKRTFTSSVSGNGTVAPASGSMFYNNDVVAVTATADEGWKFKEWDVFGGTVGGSKNPTMVTVVNDFSAAAVFEKADGILDENIAGVNIYPNPFSDVVTISYELTTTSQVNVYVYDAVGKAVNVLVNAEQMSGVNTITWSGTDASGNSLDNGVYFIRLQVNNSVSIQKVILNR